MLCEKFGIRIFVGKLFKIRTQIHCIWIIKALTNTGENEVLYFYEKITYSILVRRE